MKESIKKRIEAVRRGEIPEGYVFENHQLYPADWQYEKIGGFLTPYDEYSNDIEKYPLATSSRQGLMLQSKYYSDQRYEETSGGFHIVPDGYVTYRHMSDDDIFRFNINEMGMPVLVSPEYPVFTTTDGLNQDMLVAYLNNMKEFRAYCSAQKKGSTRTRMYFSRLCEFAIPIPPVSEQRRIAEILATCDRVIELKQQLLEEKRRQKQWLMQKLLDPHSGMRLPGYTGNWKKHRLGSLGFTYSGLSGKSEDDFGEGAPYIPYVNVFDNPIVDVEHFDYVRVCSEEKQSHVCYGDIFFTTSSETPTEIGMSSVYLGPEQELYLNSFCFGFRLNNFEMMVPEYAAYCFRGLALRKMLYMLAQGATRYNLSKTDFMKQSIVLPPTTKEQRAIAGVLLAADREIETNKRELEAWQQKKKALMQLLLTGLVRVNA